MFVIKCLIIYVLVPLSSCARIFAYIPTPSISHQVFFRPLWIELSLRGHQVTVLTTDPINNSSLTNLTEVDLHFSYEIMKKEMVNVIESSNAFQTVRLFVEMLTQIMDEQMQHPFVKQLLSNSTETFDLVLAEHGHSPPIAFAKRFNCPLVVISSLPIVEQINRATGIPTHPVLYKDVVLPFTKAKTLFERISSVIYTVLTHLYWIICVKPTQNELNKKYFGTEIGTVDEMLSNTSLLLINSNFILDGPRPLPPTVIHIRGIHKVPSKPLPKSLKAVLDRANNGFIYFSLGSNVKSKDIPLKTRQALIDTFSELPYQILWKFELDNLQNKPDNVIISKWFPQTDVFKHPNIKLFVTQGGLQSIEEAINEGVPMVGIPVFADQPTNVESMVNEGFGLSVNFATLEKEELKKTILEVINNPIYRKKIKEMAMLLQDQPTDPLEQAIWWIEYVIRHKGTSHLRNPLLDIPWYQYLLIDVVVCLLIFFISLLCVIVLTFRLLHMVIILVVTKAKEKLE